MTFLYPLGLLGLIGVPIVIIIYILRSKFNELTVTFCKVLVFVIGIGICLGNADTRNAVFKICINFTDLNS